jgi:hypothetical protein
MCGNDVSNDVECKWRARRVYELRRGKGMQVQIGKCKHTKHTDLFVHNWLDLFQPFPHVLKWPPSSNLSYPLLKWWDRSLARLSTQSWRLSLALQSTGAATPITTNSSLSLSLAHISALATSSQMDGYLCAHNSIWFTWVTWMARRCCSNLFTTFLKSWML